MMESSVIAKRYMGLGYSDASLSYMLRLRERAMKYGGDFLFLWHNEGPLTFKGVEATP